MLQVVQSKLSAKKTTYTSQNVSQKVNSLTTPPPPPCCKKTIAQLLIVFVAVLTCPFQTGHHLERQGDGAVKWKHWGGSAWVAGDWRKAVPAFSSAWSFRSLLLTGVCSDLTTSREDLGLSGRVTPGMSGSFGGVRVRGDVRHCNRNFLS